MGCNKQKARTNPSLLHEQGTSTPIQRSFIPSLNSRTNNPAYFSTLFAYSFTDVSLTGSAFNTALMSIDVALAYPSISPVNDFSI